MIFVFLSSHVKKTVQRIVSLVPSQTELLHALGLNDEVVGITKFCVHPEEWFRSKTRIGGTKNIHLDKIKSLHPDLIIANKEENLKDQVEALQEFAKVYVSDVNNLNDAIEMILDIGELINKKEQAIALTSLINEKFSLLKNNVTQKRSSAYFIWKDPYMVAGGGTFINEMMQYAGFENIFKERSRYPETKIEELQQLDCEYILLSSEPYPFQQKHIDELQSLLPSSKIILVDGEMFSWYGNRMLLSAEYFNKLMLTV
ncbi:MAG: ABC transporter substrate-binding protein [Bacteroidetes bacterium]|nr:ABC transporter substrate-binding protein [Bacteroidota bacterium]